MQIIKITKIIKKKKTYKFARFCFRQIKGKERADKKGRRGGRPSFAGAGCVCPPPPPPDPPLLAPQFWQRADGEGPPSKPPGGAGAAHCRRRGPARPSAPSPRCGRSAPTSPPRTQQHGQHRVR